MATLSVVTLMQRDWSQCFKLLCSQVHQDNRNIIWRRYDVARVAIFARLDQVRQFAIAQVVQRESFADGSIAPHAHCPSIRYGPLPQKDAHELNLISRFSEIHALPFNPHALFVGHSVPITTMTDRPSFAHDLLPGFAESEAPHSAVGHGGLRRI